MRQIKELAEFIRDELEDAEKYALIASRYSDNDAKLANIYKQISQQELGHVDLEHGEAIRFIKSAKDAGIVVPESMQAVWDW